MSTSIRISIQVSCSDKFVLVCFERLVVCFKYLFCSSGFGTVVEVFVEENLLQRRIRPMFSQTQLIQWITNWIALRIRAINAQLSAKIRFEISYRAQNKTRASVRQQMKNPGAIINICEIITIHKYREPNASLVKWNTLNIATNLSSIIQAACLFLYLICN